jgi:hypothetical protein
LPAKGSKEPLDYTSNPTVQYVKETTTKVAYDPSQPGISYQYPPMMGSSVQDAGPQRFVRFDGSQSVVSGGGSNAGGATKTTTKKTVVTKEVIQEEP